MNARKFIFLIVAISLLIVYSSCRRSTLDCPKPPEQVNKEWKVDVDAAIAKIGLAKGIELKAKTNRATQDLMGKYPNADRIYLEQMMFSAYCSVLRYDETLTQTEKAERLKEYRRELRESFQPEKRSAEQKNLTRPILKLESHFNMTPPYFTILNDGPVEAKQLKINLCSLYVKDGKIKLFGYSSDKEYVVHQLDSLKPIAIRFDEKWLNTNARLQKPLEHNILEIRLTYRRPSDLQQFQESAFYFINPEGRWVSENDNSLAPKIYDPIKRAVLKDSKKMEIWYPADALHPKESLK